MGELGCEGLDTQQRPLGDGARLRGCFTPAQPKSWSPPAVGRLGPVSLNPRAEMLNFGSGLPLPTLWDRWDLPVSVLSACLFVSGSLVVSPSSPILLPREEAPEVACPLLSHTHTLSLFFQFANSALELGSASGRKNLPLPPPPATSPALCSLHQPGTPSSQKALLPCRTQMSPGALMPPPCGPPVPGVPEPFRGAPAVPPAHLGRVLSPRDHEWGQEEE